MTATPTKEVTVDEILPLSVRVNQWVEDLCKCLDENYVRSYPGSDHKMVFRYEAGRKYYKIMMYEEQGDERRSQGVHAFVDKKTGEVYKPASWRGPAKIVRYDLRIIRERQECFARADWAGGYLYVR